MAKKKIQILVEPEKELPAQIELSFEQFSKLTSFSSVKFKVVFFLVPSQKSAKYNEKNGQAYFVCVLDPKMEKDGFNQIRNVLKL
jgi:hypothetical protein